MSEASFVVATDKKEKIKLESAILSACWVPGYAHAGFEAAFKVSTVFIAEGSSIEIKGKSSKGKAPDTVKGKVFDNKFTGTLLIPENAAVGSEAWFEVKLPKHGLTHESNRIPVRPALRVRQLQWDRSIIRRKEVVKMLCRFEDGVQDGEDAIVTVYEHNPDSCDCKVVSFPATISGNRIELQWEFDFFGDTSQIPTNEEKKKVQKQYIPPQYYFMVVVDGVAIGKDRESGLLKFADWLTIEVKKEDGAPFENATCSIILPDGKERSEKTDADGTIELKDIPPGSSILSFPDIGKVTEAEIDEAETSDDNPPIFRERIICGSGRRICVREAPLIFSE